MANDPEKVKVDDTNEEGEDRDERCSDHETDTGEIVRCLPVLSVSDSHVVEREEEEEVSLKEQAVVAAKLVIAAVEEEVVKGKIDVGGSGEKTKIRPRDLTNIDEEAGSSAKGEAKKSKNKAMETFHGPKTLPTPTCDVCGKCFVSKRSLAGHMNAHRDRVCQDVLDDPIVAAAYERFLSRGQNSSSGRVSVGGGSSSGIASGGGSGGGVTNASGSESGRGIDVDLNEKPVEEVEEVTESTSVVKFDLNKSPPKDGEDEKAK